MSHKRKEKSEKRPSRLSAIQTEENESSVSLFLRKDLLELFSPEDLAHIEEMTDSKITNSIERFFIQSRSVPTSRKVACILESLARSYSRCEKLYDGEVDDLTDEYFPEYESNPKYEKFSTDWNGKPIWIKTENQQRYIDAMKTCPVTIAHGSAGTGKTKLALAMGLSCLESRRFSKMLIIRPLTTVGEDMGYLPGGVDEKYGPYSSPIVEALTDLLGENNYKEMIHQKKIVFIPATFIRGANFKDAFILVDEAQNLSKMEVLTILTRLCQNTKIVITGDESQCDRKKGKNEMSGLEACIRNLSTIEEVSIVKFGKSDIQRSEIVEKVITNFE